MPLVIGGLMAIVALSASYFGGVDPMGSLVRAGIAFATGLVATQAWQAFVPPRPQIEVRSPGAKPDVDSGKQE